MPDSPTQDKQDSAPPRNDTPVPGVLYTLARKLSYVRHWETRRLLRRQKTAAALVALEKRLQPADILRYLADRHHQEQTFFWVRFAPFLALNAAVFGIVSQRPPTNPLPLAIGGTFLAAFWLFIQWKSLEYVDLAKEPYFAYLRHLGVPWHHEPQTLDATDPSPTELGMDRAVSSILPPESMRDRLTTFLLNSPNSTWLAVVSSAGVFTLWLWWLLAILFA